MVRAMGVSERDGAFLADFHRGFYSHSYIYHTPRYQNLMASSFFASTTMSNILVVSRRFAKTSLRDIKKLKLTD